MHSIAFAFACLVASSYGSYQDVGDSMVLKASKPQERAAKANALQSFTRLLLAPAYPAAAWSLAGLGQDAGVKKLIHNRGIGALSKVSAGRSSMVTMELDDDALSSELAKRVAGVRQKGELPPLSPEEVSADKLHADEIIPMVFDALKYGRLHYGCFALMGFSAKSADGEKFGYGNTLRPGMFESPIALGDELLINPLYRSIAKMSDWKMVQKISNGPRSIFYTVLIKRGDLDWEVLVVQFRKASVAEGIRWLIMDLHKNDYYDDDGNKLTSNHSPR